MSEKRGCSNFPPSPEPPLMSRLLNPDTDAVQPFPPGTLENGIYDRSLLSKSPSLMLAFIAHGNTRMHSATHEQHSITGSLYNIRYRNQTHQLPHLAPLLRAHILECLELIAAPLIEAEKAYDMLHPEDSDG